MQAESAPPPGDDQKPVRIAKAIARAGLASRRDAETWIMAGRVAVNGETITTPAVTVTARDRITVDGAPLPQRERTRLFLYYKPVGLVTTNADPEGRPTIFSALPKNLPRLISVGRLDIATEGLLLLTNDGGLARTLELPSTGWLRRYRVRAHGRVDQDALDRLRDGLTVDGIHYGPIEATLDRDLGTNVWLTLGIREGKNREVRNVVEALGLQVNRLIRVSFGPFQLGDMAEGEVTEVKTRVLREQLGEHVIAEAGCDFSSPIAAREEAEERAPPRQERITREKRAERVTRDQRGERPARREDRPRRAEDARSSREDRPRRGEDVRSSREDKSASRRDEGDRRQGPRDGRPPRRDRDEAVAPGGRQARFRRPRRDDRDVDEKPAGRPRRGHAWRSDDAPLGRHYRGAGTKARQLPDDAERPKRAGLIADRKGRRVLVERFGEKPMASTASPRDGETGAKHRDRGKFKPSAAKRTPLLGPPPQGGRERSRTDQRPRNRPEGHHTGPDQRGRKPDRYGSKSERYGSKPQRRGDEADRRGSKPPRWDGKQPRRPSFAAPPVEGEVGATRREGGNFRARVSKSTPLADGGRKVPFSATAPRREGKPGGYRSKPSGGGDRPNRPPGKPGRYRGKGPPGRGGKPGTPDRPRGAGPRPSRPGGPKRR